MSYKTKDFKITFLGVTPVLQDETGYLKPQKEAYEHVIKKLKAIPSDIFFFDDANINVKAAISAGLNAFQATSPQEIYDIMETV